MTSENKKKIKLLSKNLTSKECAKLIQYYEDLQSKRHRQEIEQQILSLGIGGHVVYISAHQKYDVLGTCGTITSIHHKTRTVKGKKITIPIFTVKFDKSIGEKTYRSYSNEFLSWNEQLLKENNSKKMQELKQEIEQSKYKGGFYQKAKKYYQHVLQKPIFTERNNHINTLYNIGSMFIKPATPENIKQAKDTQKRQPIIDEMNKAFGKI